MSDFNYFDELRTGNTQQWISYLNREYMRLNAPQIWVFKLDKEKSQEDDLYGETQIARIYLPAFSIRAYHLDNTWRQVLGEGTMPYLETQDNIQFVLNFEDMVQTIRDLKVRHTTDIFIDYTGNGEATASKSNDQFIIKVDGAEVANFDLTSSSYNTTNKLTSAISGLSGFLATSEGQNDSSSSLVSFRETRFYKSSKLNIYSEDETYQNSTDVIEAGDLVLTHKWFLYEVLSNLPGGDYGWDYATYVLSCNIRSVDKAQLPNNYIEQIRRHEYGLRDKIEME